MSIEGFFAEQNRAGPGDAFSLRWAIAAAGLRPDGVVLDAGCGPGADCAVLRAAVPQGRVVGVDRSALFIERLRADHAGIAAHVGDMTDPPGGPFDLIWSAGAIYTVGIPIALTAWRGHLRPGGRGALSHLCWRVPHPSLAARTFWATEADMTDAPGIEAQVQAAGYRVIATQWLAEAAWDAYYADIELALDRCTDPAMIADFRAEIALWRAHQGDYGYLIVVTEPA